MGNPKLESTSCPTHKMGNANLCPYYEIDSGNGSWCGNRQTCIPEAPIYVEFLWAHSLPLTEAKPEIHPTRTLHKWLHWKECLPRSGGAAEQGPKPKPISKNYFLAVCLTLPSIYSLRYLDPEGNSRVKNLRISRSTMHITLNLLLGSVVPWNLRVSNFWSWFVINPGLVIPYYLFGVMPTTIW